MLNRKLAIIIVNYNCATDTVECLNSLYKVNLEQAYFTIVDNNSSDNSVELLTDHIEKKCRSGRIYDSNSIIDLKSKDDTFSKINFIKSDKNLGFAGGNNLALDFLLTSGYFSTKDHILLLNPDTIVTKNTLRSFLEIKNNSFIASCTIKSYQHPKTILSYGGYKINRFFGLIRPSGKNEEPDYVYGGALATNFYTIEKLGMLPSEYFLYWEETDFCTKAKKTGIPLLLINNTFILDKVGQSTGRGKLANYYFVRNSFLFFKKYYPRSVFTLFITNTLRIFHKLVKGDYESAKGMFLGITDYLKSNYGYKDFS